MSVAQYIVQTESGERFLVKSTDIVSAWAVAERKNQGKVIDVWRDHEYDALVLQRAARAPA